MIVFFDIGSTLIEGPASGPGQRIATELGLGAESIPAMNEILFKTDALQSSELAERVRRQFGTDQLLTSAVLERIWQAQFEESYVLPGAENVIESLRAAAIQRVYVSNIWRPFYLRFETAFPHEANAQPCFPSFRTHKMKPDTQLLRSVCSEIGVTPQDVVMVGDTWVADMAPAIETGMATIWMLHRPHKERADLVRVLNGTSPAPDITLERIDQLTTATIQQAYEVHARRCRGNPV